MHGHHRIPTLFEYLVLSFPINFHRYTRSWFAIVIIFKALFPIGFRPTTIIRLLRNSSRQVHRQNTATAGAEESGDLEGLGAVP